MPTGYTCDVQDGKITEFRDFAMRCARAFGALILMRDDPTDAPIPYEFQPSDYNAKRLDELEIESAALVSMTVAEAATHAQRQHDEEVERREKWSRSSIQHKARYEAMLVKVRAWKPPSTDHENLKSFMETQLLESIQWDCSDHETPPILLTGEQWLETRRQDVARNIAYHRQQDAEEVERTRQRNEWVRLLRESLVLAERSKGGA